MMRVLTSFKITTEMIPFPKPITIMFKKYIYILITFILIKYSLGVGWSVRREFRPGKYAQHKVFLC